MPCVCRECYAIAMLEGMQWLFTQIGWRSASSEEKIPAVYALTGGAGMRLRSFEEWQQLIVEGAAHASAQKI